MRQRRHPDASYPAYEPYDPAGSRTASIGEYGLDIADGTVMSPATFKDMMSYCGPRWISLHNYGKLVNHSKLDPRRVCVDYPWWRDVVLYDRNLIPERWLPDPPPDRYVRVVDPEPLISIIGVLHSERQTRGDERDARRHPARADRGAADGDDGDAARRRRRGDRPRAAARACAPRRTAAAAAAGAATTTGRATR